MRKIKKNWKPIVLLAGIAAVLILAVIGLISIISNLLNNNSESSGATAQVTGTLFAANPADTENPSNTQEPTEEPLPVKQTLSIDLSNDILIVKNALNNYNFINKTGENTLLVFIKTSNLDETGFKETSDSEMTDGFSASESNGGVFVSIAVNHPFTLEDNSDGNDLILKIKPQKNASVIEYRNDLSRIYLNIHEARLCSESDSFIKNYIEVYDEFNHIYTILIDKKYMPEIQDEKIILNDKTIKSIEIKNRTSDIQIIFDVYEKTTIYPNTRDYDAAFTFLKEFKGDEPFVVLDPGHGGIDGGTTNPDKTILEKNIVLNMCRIITEQLTEKGYHVINLREEDIFLGLMERTDIANLAGADAIISVHVNSYTAEHVNGATTLYKTSDALAEAIQTSVVSTTGANSLGTVKMLDLSILNRAEMAAVIIETGFLSNTEEGKLLNTAEYQEKMATGIANGIIKYFNSK